MPQRTSSGILPSIPRVNSPEIIPRISQLMLTGVTHWFFQKIIQYFLQDFLEEFILRHLQEEFLQKFIQNFFENSMRVFSGIALLISPGILRIFIQDFFKDFFIAFRTEIFRRLSPRISCCKISAGVDQKRKHRNIIEMAPRAFLGTQ